MKILFCTDGSTISYNALKNFSKWTNNIEIDIFCSADWSFLPDNIAIEDYDFSTRCTNSAQNILTNAKSYFEQQGLNISNTIKMCGSTVDSILEVCDKNKYDIVVLGSHGKKGVQKWLGSVSSEVSDTSSISTFISKGENSCQKILFPIEPDVNNEETIKKALNYLYLKDKEIHLMTVYDSPDYLFLEGNIDTKWMLEIEEKEKQEGLKLLDRYEAIFNDLGVKVYTKKVVIGVPAILIPEYTIANKIDLVVCGVKKRNMLSKFLLSSVSKRLLENSISDILIIRDN